MDNLERRYALPELRFVTTAKTDETTEATRAGGYAALYNSASYDLGGFTEVLAPGAFTRSIDAIHAGRQNVFLFWQHDTGAILASTRSGTLVLSEDETGLKFDFDTSGLTEQQAKTLARGDLQVSFGFMVREDIKEEFPGTTGIRTITDLDLFEVSLVTYPAYGATTVAMRSWEAFKEARNAESEAKAEEPAAPEEFDDQDSTELLKQLLMQRLKRA